MSSSTRPSFLLFVYGTLRSTFQNPYARLLAQSADLLGPGRVRGHLYRIKGYRGIRLEADTAEWIAGEIHRLHDLRILAALDRYEGPDYERVFVRVVRQNGSGLRCWIYQVKVEQVSAHSARCGTGALPTCP